MINLVKVENRYVNVNFIDVISIRRDAVEGQGDVTLFINGSDAPYILNEKSMSLEDCEKFLRNVAAGLARTHRSFIRMEEFIGNDNVRRTDGHALTSVYKIDGNTGEVTEDLEK